MIWVVVFLIMLLVMLGMSIDVIMGRRLIAGSYGGIANLGIEKDDCPICDGDQDKCEEANAGSGKAAKPRLAYDANRD
ncbi:(Na+)-NQR maturation NqrM [Azorhizophilus paspali]|uniref:(Na+)-NQR maturation NqrM n=1 Tax=Azorhizophilus paspali TaxID=69963 RepID=A0ABV6SJ86_AZOPA